MARLQTFMEAKKLPLSLQIKLRRHFRFFWLNASASSEDEQELLGGMSAPLRHEVLRYVYKETVGNLPIFDRFPDAGFHEQLLRCLKPLALAPGEVLIRQGATDTEAFLTVRGALDVLYVPNSRTPYTTHMLGYSDDNEEDGETNAGAVNLLNLLGGGATGKSKGGGSPLPSMKVLPVPKEVPQKKLINIRITSIGPGEVIGEMSELFRRGDSIPRRAATVETTDHCELFSIAGDEFAATLESFPEVRQFMMELAQTRFKQLREIDRLARRAHNAATASIELGTKLLKRPVTPDMELLEEKLILDVFKATIGTGRANLAVRMHSPHLLACACWPRPSPNSDQRR